MNHCILCHSNELICYGDEIYGNIFCKSCFEQYSCSYCNKMNINLQIRENIVINFEPKKLYGQRVERGSIIEPLMGANYQFKLYCKECWDKQEMYNEDDNDSVEPDDNDIESYYSENEEDDVDEYGNLDSYYAGKGKYEIY